MPIHEDQNPLDEIEDEAPSTPESTRAELLGDAKRGFLRLRKDFVQRTQEPRGDTVLSRFVSGHKERPLDLLLTIHALEPILDGTPLHISTWARMLKCTERTIKVALNYLEQERLIEISGKSSSPTIQLMKENGDGTSWEARTTRNAENRGFFTLPFEYWATGTIDELKLPGKAMLLIILKETQDPNAKRKTFLMAFARAKQWYGISERTAERGIHQLRKAGLLQEKRQLVQDSRHPLGLREDWHRILIGPYSTAYREKLRIRARKASQNIAATS